jgi:hypothetical protein
MSGVRPCVGSFRRVAALVCAVVYISCATELLPEALALGAWVEGSHQVLLACKESGLSVILSHQRGCPGRSDYSPCYQAGNPADRHGAAARLVCLFAAHGAATADHIASFANPTTTERTSPGVKAKPAANRPLMFDLALADLRVALPLAATAAKPALPWPARTSGALVCLRSTVLVI